jgi:hypothetical protein
LLKVLGEASVAIEPCQGSFDDAAARQKFEALSLVGALDDLECPVADAAQGIAELVASITAIGEQVSQPGEAVDDLGEQQRRAIAILDVGGVDQGMNQIALGVGEDMALAPLVFLPAS